MREGDQWVWGLITRTPANLTSHPPTPHVNYGGPRGHAAKCPGQEERSPGQVLAGSGYCKWFNVRMGFGFVSMTQSEGRPVDPPLDVFVHQVSPSALLHSPVHLTCQFGFGSCDVLKRATCFSVRFVHKSRSVLVLRLYL
ncbi:protein lin-28 homolog B [Tachysurus ichikawai]